MLFQCVVAYVKIWWTTMFPVEYAEHVLKGFGENYSTNFPRQPWSSLGSLSQCLLKRVKSVIQTGWDGIATFANIPFEASQWRASVLLGISMSDPNNILYEWSQLMQSYQKNIRQLFPSKTSGKKQRRPRKKGLDAILWRCCSVRCCIDEQLLQFTIAAQRGCMGTWPLQIITYR